jgi:hypothetical protein
MSENLQLLQALTQKTMAIEWFKGLFREAHLEITDTGEQFTVLHHGDRAEVLAGFQAAKPNFVIPLESENIRRLAAAFSDDAIDAQEQYRIVKFMLKPCLKAALNMPILKNKTLVKIVKVDTHWQEAILDPQGNEDEQVTIIYVNKQWLVIPGYHGQPQRRFRLKPEQLLEFQRRVFEADASGKLSSWVKLARWYVKWREEITVPV